MTETIKYPISFLNRNKNQIFRKSKKDISIDGTPRYIINPKAYYNTYSLKTCFENNWTPIYTPYELGQIKKENKI